MTVVIMQGKLPWLYREGGAVIFLVFQSICGSDEAGNHDPLAGSDSASIFILSVKFYSVGKFFQKQ